MTEASTDLMANILTYFEKQESENMEDCDGKECLCSACQEAEWTDKQKEANTLIDRRERIEQNLILEKFEILVCNASRPTLDKMQERVNREIELDKTAKMEGY